MFKIYKLKTLKVLRNIFKFNNRKTKKNKNLRILRTPNLLKNNYLLYLILNINPKMKIIMRSQLIGVILKK
jgi:hypothetical protein